jgi:hypothetical protein
LEIVTSDAGVALIKAKQDYYLEDDEYDYFDEKMMLSTNLYGLPMVKVESPGAPAAAPTLAKEKCPVRVSRSSADRIKEHLTIEVAKYESHETADTIYYTIPGGRVQVNYNKPALPYITMDIYSPEEVKGIIITGSEYQEVSLEKPLLISIPCLGGEISKEEESSGFVCPTWYPAQLAKVNKIKMRDGTTIQRLVISTAQYLQPKNRIRLYSKVELDVYYAPLPTIAELEDVMNYPNPCYPDGDPVEGERQVVKICVPPDAEGVKIHIYNIAGELVKL